MAEESPDLSRPAGQAEVQLPCADLPPTLEFFVERLGFRIEAISPAERPAVASISGLGLRLRLAPGGGGPGTIRIARGDLAAGEERVLIAPNGTRIEFVDEDPPIEIPPLQSQFLISRPGEGEAAGEGRAGMLYRDLIPGRLGGRYIASHISIPRGGPVADFVHFHKIGFQLIFCRRGWVRLVYEDQGEPFVMAAGDCVLQPPRIRHRVLECSPGLEVVEVASPALHETLADHEMRLPTGRLAPDREFGGQLFLFHRAARRGWTADLETGFQQRRTGIGGATGGIADARVLRSAGADSLAAASNRSELLFGFVLEGSAVLQCRGDHRLSASDAFVIPAAETWALRNCSADLALLEVTAPQPSASAVAAGES